MDGRQDAGAIDTQVCHRYRQFVKRLRLGRWCAERLGFVKSIRRAGAATGWSYSKGAINGFIIEDKGHRLRLTRHGLTIGFITQRLVGKTLALLVDQNRLFAMIMGIGNKVMGRYNGGRGRNQMTIETAHGSTGGRADSLPHEQAVASAMGCGAQNQPVSPAPKVTGGEIRVALEAAGGQDHGIGVQALLFAIRPAHYQAVDRAGVIGAKAHTGAVGQQAPALGKKALHHELDKGAWIWLHQVDQTIRQGWQQGQGCAQLLEPLHSRRVLFHQDAP